MKRIYLYLDESGDFAEDGSMKDPPSLVGGYLTYDKPMSPVDAREICRGQQIHSWEMPSNVFASLAVEIMNEMKSRGCYLVIFENKELLEIVDGDTTYLNIISEGVVQLMQLLKSQFGSIEFNLLVAQRVAVNRKEYKYRPEGYYISWAEYRKRLQEKIIIGASKVTTNFNIKNWNMEFADARVDFRLMLSDVVCHSKFRLNRKFNTNQISVLNNLFSEGFLFSVFPGELETSIRRYLIKGNIAEAIFETLVSDNKIIAPRQLIEIKNSLEIVNESSMDIQYKMLFSRILNLLHVSNEYELIQSILNKLRKYYIINSNFKILIPVSFKMDISLLSLTIATHEGAINKANSEIEYCLELLPLLVRRWESLDYYFIFKIRYAIHLINSYNNMGCIEEMNQLEHIIDNTFTLFPLAEGFGDLCKDIKSDIKGKVIGTRLQARINLMKIDPTQYELATNDSESAISEFFRISDLKRQYQYRSRIEYEAGNCEAALLWLKRSIIEEDYLDDLNKMFSIIINGDKIQAAFTIMHLTSIMLLAFESNNEEICSDLFLAWNRNNMNEYLASTCSEIHPYEIIYWKLGKLLYLTGSGTAGEEKINIALKICNKSRNNLTLKAIGLGILADKAYLLSATTSDKQYKLIQVISTLCSEYEIFMGMELPDTMKKQFEIWRKNIAKYQGKKNKLDFKDLKYLSEQIHY